MAKDPNEFLRSLLKTLDEALARKSKPPITPEDFVVRESKLIEAGK